MVKYFNIQASESAGDKQLLAEIRKRVKPAVGGSWLKEVEAEEEKQRQE